MAIARGDIDVALRMNASVVVLLAALVLLVATVLLRRGWSGLAALARSFIAPPQHPRQYYTRMLAFFAVWWAWDLARW